MTYTRENSGMIQKTTFDEQMVAQRAMLPPAKINFTFHQQKKQFL